MLDSALERFILPEDLKSARCPLFGLAPEEMRIDGEAIPPGFLRPELQPHLGLEGYDAGVRILEACLHDATLEEYLEITPMPLR